MRRWEDPGTTDNNPEQQRQQRKRKTASSPSSWSIGGFGEFEVKVEMGAQHSAAASFSETTTTLAHADGGGRDDAGGTQVSGGDAVVGVGAAKRQQQQQRRRWAGGGGAGGGGGAEVLLTLDDGGGGGGVEKQQQHAVVVFGCRRDSRRPECAEMMRQAHAVHLAALGPEFVGPDDPRWVDRVVVAVSAASGLVVGQAGVRCRRGWPDAHVVTLAVDPAWRRRGVGGAILEGVKAVARRGGYPSVTLHVDSQNTGALMLYRKAGFAPTSRPDPHMYGANRPGLEMRCRVAAVAGETEGGSAAALFR